MSHIGAVQCCAAGWAGADRSAGCILGAPHACCLQGAAEPPGLDAGQHSVLEGEGRLLMQLLDNRGMDDYQLPIRCGAVGGCGSGAHPTTVER